MRNIERIDKRIIRWAGLHEVGFARIAIAVVYIWFGALKLAGVSPAGSLVAILHQTTIPFIPFWLFYPLFSVFEVIIGLMILKKGWERVTIPLLLLHLFTTALPLVMLPHLTWTGPFALTIEGQYIVKNILIIALAIDMAAGLQPIQLKHKS